MARRQPEDAQVRRPRLVPRDGGRLRVVARGGRRYTGKDIYVHLLSLPWPLLILLIVILYLLANAAFALMYLTLGDVVGNARSGAFTDAFFFSVQTMTTLGGRAYPVGLAANIVQAGELLAGFGFFALGTAMVFAKFSRPNARVLFSKVAVIAPYDGVPHLMFRLANERGNHIVDATLQLVLVRTFTEPDGAHHRRFDPLSLVIARVPFLQVNWTARHKIDETSPLYGIDLDALRDAEGEIIVSLTGLDESFSQSIHARYSYIAEEIRDGMVFEDIMNMRDHALEVSYDRFHDVKPAGEPTGSGGSGE